MTCGAIFGSAARFSTKLRNKISDDVIDLLTGHTVRFGGAYLGDNLDELRKQLVQAGIIDLLMLEGREAQISEINELRAKVEHYETEMIELRKTNQKYEKIKDSASTIDKLLKRVEQLERRLNGK